MTLLFEKARRPVRLEWSGPKEPTFDPGYEPGLLGQEAIALPLPLPPWPSSRTWLPKPISSCQGR